MGGYDDKEVLKNVWEWDATDENAEWIDKPSMPIPRRWFSIAKTDDKIFIYGGKVGFFQPTNLVKMFDGKVWRNGPKMPTYQCQAAVVVIPMAFARDLN